MVARTSTTAARCRARGLVVRDTDRFVMVMGPGTADPLKLEGLARAVWDALDRPQTGAEITAALADRHGVDVDALRADVEATLLMLEAAGIVVEPPIVVEAPIAVENPIAVESPIAVENS